MKVLGINDGHNAAACLYEEGNIVAAVQEERLRRIKNWAGMPIQAIGFVLNTAGGTSAPVDWITMHGNHAANVMNREELMEDYRRINALDVTVKRRTRRAARQLARVVG